MGKGSGKIGSGTINEERRAGGLVNIEKSWVARAKPEGLARGTR
jgi:hypothetical protein